MSDLRTRAIQLAQSLPNGSLERKALLEVVAARPGTQFAGEAEVAEVRGITRGIARKYGIPLAVRKGSGSVKGMVLVMSGRPDPEDSTARIELIKALMAAGYEDAVGGSTLRDQLKLSEQWGHAIINLHVAKLA